MNGYEIVHEYAPYILTTILPRVEQHEKDIYHELRELNKLPKTKITQNNENWKEELRQMLSLQGYQLEPDDIDWQDLTNSLKDVIYKKGYGLEIMEDLGIQSLIETLSTGQFSNNKKVLSPNQIEGLKKELLVTIRRHA